MRLPSNYHYFDYAAGWPVHEEALATYVRVARQYGNPGSVHQAGQRALTTLDKSRADLAVQLGSDPKEIIITSTATEANNLAIIGTIRAFHQRHPDVVPRVLYSAIEHDAVRIPIEHFAAQGEIDAVKIPVHYETGIDLTAIEQALTQHTALISVMHVNNETGMTFPLKRIRALLDQHRDGDVWPRFHSDAAQALAYVEERATDYADLVTYSGYKVGGVAGSAMLIAQRFPEIEPLIRGGGQERGLRAGTEDVAAFAACVTAIERVREHQQEEQKRMSMLQHHLLSELAKRAPQIQHNGHPSDAPHITNLWIPDTHAQQTVARLDLAGYAIAAGPACSTRSIEPSKTLQALGYTADRVRESVRISMGPGTTIEAINGLVEHLSHGAIKY